MNDKEKQIKEMAKILSQADENSYAHCGSTKSCKECKYHIGKFPCTQNCRAEALYNAGYRKVHDFAKWHAEEQLKLSENVSKETAREILQQIKTIWKANNGVLQEYMFDNIGEKYGVEVE